MNRWIAVALACSTVASAAPPERGALPPPLRDWTAWVLHGEEERLCPSLHGRDERVCTWPGRLELSLNDKGGRFTQVFRVYRKEWVALPGDLKRWPQNVTTGGKPAVVTERAGRPVVELAPGEHTVSGELTWDSMPEAVQIPASTGLLALSVGGREVALPNRDESGQVYLQKEASAEEEAENVEVRVYRRVVDEIPLILDTVVQLEVSGKSREVSLGRVLPPGFVPMSLASGLPVRLEPDGRLKVQARAGSWTLELSARSEGPVAALSRPKVEGGLWTEGDEVWVFDARPSLRQVLVEGVPAVDPQQTTLPEAWKRLPAYALGPADTLRLTERRRGDADPAPDLLKLHRMMWLDFDGRGYTVNDRLHGTLHRSWRLEMQPPTELGRVVAGGADQLITRLGEGQPPGVELRQGIFTLEADSRIPGRTSRVPAVSWDADFHQVSGTLNLPPGWRLVHAGGADEVQSTWVRQWSLLDIFLVLIVAVAVGRLFGLAWGVLALAAFALLFPESGAPQWVWLFVLAGEALWRVLPDGGLRTFVRLYRLAAWAALVLISVPFVVTHVRQGMYPALEHPWHRMGGVQTHAAYLADNEATYQRSQQQTGWDEAPPPQAQAAQRVEEDSRASGSALLLGKSADAPVQKQRPKAPSFKAQDYDKNAMVQTGPGLPRWTWNAVSLSFSGPVERGQELHLYLASPRVNLVLAFLRVLLLCALVLCVLGFPGKFWPGFLRRGGPAAARGGGHAVMLAFAGATLLFPAQARAEGPIPGPEILAELRQRLLERPGCEPSCASSPRLTIEGNPKTLRLRLEVHAAADAAIPLPGNAQHWTPSVVLLDGRPASGLRRDEEGTLWLTVTPGSHLVLLEGAMPPRQTVQLPLPLRSHLVRANVDGFRIDGIHEDGLADDNLQLTRIARGEKAEAETFQTGNLPPFVVVQRDLTLGLQWTTVTTVRRLTPPGSAVVLEIPLLAGESVTTQDVRVVNGKALVNMGPGAAEVRWTSVLAEKSPIVLTAPAELGWVERWRLEVSPVWHVEMTGIPPVHQQDASGARLPEWRPWPGERVTVEVTRPQAVSGQTLTIDQSLLRISPGLRATDGNLTANLRSSRGGLHTFTLPEDAQLQTVTINGQSQPIRQEGQQVSIPLVPGSQNVELTWRQTAGLSTSWRSPVVDLGTGTVNAELHTTLPSNRWVLWVSGPRMGPAVLFWSLLLVLLVVAVGLGRIRLTPLRSLSWVLLMLGLSQVPIPAAALVVGWLLVLGWRKDKADTGDRVVWFNLRQLLLAGWTLVAVGILCASIYGGLLGQPEMQIAGNGSSAYELHWFQDRTADLFPRGYVLSVPMLVYRAAMLAWSLWLAFALIRWLKWAWAAFSEGGLWRRSPRKPPPVPAPAPPVT